jgi:hypothetical protein
MGPWVPVCPFCAMSATIDICTLSMRRGITAAWMANNHGRLQNATRMEEQRPKSEQELTQSGEVGCALPRQIDDKSCCFMRRLSATTAPAPPDPRSLAIVLSRRTTSTKRSFMMIKLKNGAPSNKSV